MDSSFPPPSPRRPRRISVLQAQTLGPRMRRIVFGGDELRDFPDIGAGAHIKLFFAPPGAPLLLPQLGHDGVVHWPQGERPIARTYSVRSSDAARATLAVDFVLHAEHGPASQWAMQARAGDSLGVAGPGGPPLYRAEASRHLLCGDLSALPAIAAVLERLRADARGDVLIAIEHADDRQALRHPPGIAVHWLLRDTLLSAALALDWPQQLASTMSATVAGESRAVAAIRAHLLQQQGFDRRSLYAVPYWRRGRSEEDYHAERHRFMDEVPA